MAMYFPLYLGNIIEVQRAAPRESARAQDTVSVPVRTQRTCSRSSGLRVTTFANLLEAQGSELQHQSSLVRVPLCLESV